MSIQIIVETPFSYYKDCFKCDVPQKYAQKFCAEIEKHFTLKLPTDKDEVFFCADLLASTTNNISMTAGKVIPDIANMLYASLYLPGRFASTREIILPFIENNKPALIVSSCDYRKAVDEIEPILKNTFPDSFDKYKADLETYRQAIDVSEREKMPIFWSY